MESSRNASLWNVVGRGLNTPVDDKRRISVRIDSYYVVIGFEVNNKAAYQQETLNLDEDYGHAFFYLVKNDKIISLLSFGPIGWGETTWLKPGNANYRQASADYGLSEKVSAFKIVINTKQAEALRQETEKTRMDIHSGKILYAAFLNDTCAETERDVLDAANISTPSGSGWVKVRGHNVAYAVNPYKWHANLKKEIGGEKFFIPPAMFNGWVPGIGDRDQIFAD